jgi:uncharacterized protein YdcH (DUF465 family)
MQWGDRSGELVITLSPLQEHSMTHVPHELAEEFPEHREKIHTLKQNDAHFSKMVDDYHKVNREIHRIETGVQPTSEDFEKQLRRQRLALKDKILTQLSG